jgi:DNA-binding MarR family transcriptional regulator
VPPQSTHTADYRSLSDFRYEIRRFLNFSESAARQAGLEAQQHQALLAIAGLPPHQRPTVGVLAERLQVRHHSAVELVNRLAQKRLIRRAAAEADRRTVILQLTARGEKILRQVTLPHLEELQTAGRNLLRTLAAVMRGAGKNRKERS